MADLTSWCPKAVTSAEKLASKNSQSRFLTESSVQQKKSVYKLVLAEKQHEKLSGLQFASSTQEVVACLHCESGDAIKAPDVPDKGEKPETASSILILHALDRTLACRQECPY